MIKIIPAKLTGSPDSSGWAQVHDFKPAEEEKLKLRGHLIAVIATSSSVHVGVNAVLEGREILTRLHEEYFGNETLSAFDALKSAISKVSAEFSEGDEKIQIGATVVLENALYVGVSGGAKAILLRAGNLVTFSDFTSGYLKPQDMILVGTKRFFEAVPWGVVKATLESGNPESSIAELAPVIHSNKNNGDFGVFVGKFTDTDLPVIAPPVSQINYQGEGISQNHPTPPSSFQKKIVGVIDSLIGLIPDKRLYIRSDTREFGESNKKSVAIVAGVLLLILLIVSVVFGLRQSHLKESRSKYIDRLTRAEHQLEEAKSLSSLDKDRARQLLFDSKQIAATLVAEGVKDSQLDALNSNIEKSMGDIAGIYGTSPELYLDLSLLTSGFNGDRISLSDANMLVLDKSGQRVVSIDTSTKKTEIAAGPDVLKNATNIASYTDRSYVIDDNGISEVSGDSPRIVVNKDWSGSVEITAFTGNIYLAEKDKSTIWRYQGNAGIFGSKENWFGEGVSPDLSGIKSMSIDGSVWILSGNGKILKFALGKPDPFNISGVDGELGGVVGLFTSEDSENIYLLDKTNSRIIIVDKKGVYKAQYLSDQIKDASGIVVSEKDGKIILLSGPKLYSMDLKN